MLRRPLSAPRRGTATVELALVMLFVIVPLILGLWEMGRYVQVQQIVANSAREGARMAAQAVTINASGSPTQILAYSAPGSGVPNVKAAVMQYLAGAGLSRLTYSDVDVTFTFLAPEAGDPPLVNPIVGATEPYQGVQNQRFRVTVTITDMTGPTTEKAVGSRPLKDKTLWTTLGIVRPGTVYYQVDWVILVDRPFTVNATVPSW
jgi:Flp pilus assembly protein TadG